MRIVSHGQRSFLFALAGFGRRKIFALGAHTIGRGGKDKAREEEADSRKIGKELTDSVQNITHLATIQAIET